MATLPAEALISKHYHPPSFNQAVLNVGSTLESHEELLKTQLAGHIPHQIHQRMRVREEPGHWQFSESSLAISLHSQGEELQF